MHLSSIPNPLAQMAVLLRTAWQFVLLYILALAAMTYALVTTVYQQYSFVMRSLDHVETVGLVDMLQSPIVMIGLLEAALVLLIVLLAAVFLRALATRRVVSDSLLIKQQIQAMQAGDYTHRVELHKHDELRDLADAVNRLADHLNARRRIELKVV